MGVYYLEDTDLTEEKIAELLADKKMQGFGSTIYGEKQQTASDNRR